MDPTMLIGGALAVGAAAVGVGTGVRLLPIALRSNHDLRAYKDSPEALQEKRFAERDKKRRLIAHPEGSERETSIIGLDGNTIRHKDGSFSRFYEFTLQESMLAADGAAERFCDDLARLLCLQLPKDTTFQWRYAVNPDPGLAIANHLDARAYSRVHLPAVRLHDSRIDHYRNLAVAGMFRRERGMLSVRIPVRLKSDQYTTLSNAFVPQLLREISSHGFSGISDNVQSVYCRTKRDGVMRRLIDEEREACKQA